MIETLFARFEGAFVKNAIKAYRADFNRFNQWCSESKVPPLEARPEDLASLFIGQLLVGSNHHFISCRRKRVGAYLQLAPSSTLLDDAVQI